MSYKLIPINENMQHVSIHLRIGTLAVLFRFDQWFGMIRYDSIDGFRVFISYPEFQNKNYSFLINVIICSPQLAGIRRGIKAVNLKCSTFDHWNIQVICGFVVKVRLALHV